MKPEGFTDRDGEPLFDGEEPSPLLKQALDFLEQYQSNMCEPNLSSNGFGTISPMALNAKVDVLIGNSSV